MVAGGDAFYVVLRHQILPDPGVAGVVWGGVDRAPSHREGDFKICPAWWLETG